jgi:hypothetical protein
MIPEGDPANLLTYGFFSDGHYSGDAGTGERWARLPRPDRPAGGVVLGMVSERSVPGGSVVEVTAAGPDGPIRLGELRAPELRDGGSPPLFALLDEHGTLRLHAGFPYYLEVRGQGANGLAEMEQRAGFVYRTAMVPGPPTWWKRHWDPFTGDH